jgi:predicted acyltransferase
LLSLDVLRGIIMILLAAESAAVYTSLHAITENSAADALTLQFFHHPWHGLRFWDLVQPAFMFMAGAAMYIAYSRKVEKGQGWKRQWPHILKRCAWLLAWALVIYSVAAGRPVWELWNVLAQLSVTTLIAFLIIRRSVTFQVAVSVILLLATELAYRFSNIPGYDQPFTEHQNFGTWMDLVLMGKTNSYGWVAINFIPTAAHTIWGCCTGKLLIGKRPENEKMKWLLLAGLVATAAGFSLDLAGISHIIKRICTSSFVLASGGLVMLMTAICYRIVDMAGWNRYAWIAVVVGMNSLFIYILFEIMGYSWINRAVAVFTIPFFSLALPEAWAQLLTALVTLTGYWMLCWWLYRKKIFFKI